MIVHPYDDIEVLALGALDEASAARVLDHADGCPTCAVLLTDAMRTAIALEPEGERPLVAKPRINVGSRVYSGPRSSAFAWVGSLAAAAAVILLVWNLDLRSHTFPVPIASLVHSHFEHHPLRGARGAGSAKVIQSLDGSWLYLVGDGLEPKTAYTLRETANTGIHEVGTFVTTSSGQVAAFWRQPPRKIRAFSVTPVQSEPAGAGELRWP